MEPPPLARELFDKLSAVLPVYSLPEISVAHSRHYMPLGTLGKSTLVFDTWADIGKGELLVQWPCLVSEEEKDLLARLAGSLGYLGRSESWVQAQLDPDDGMLPTTFNAFPYREGERPGQKYEQVSLMAAVPADEYLTWREQQLQQAFAERPPSPGKKTPSAKLQRDKEKVALPYPSTLTECFMKDTSWWKKQGWSYPPGSQRVLYWRPSRSLQVGGHLPLRRKSQPAVSMMLLELTSPSGSSSTLPPLTRALPLAEHFHKAVISRLARKGPVDCPELTGRDPFGKPLAQNHRHAHTLPLDLDGDARTDHILIFSEMDFSALAQNAVRSVKRIWSKGMSDPIRLAVVASGELEELRNLKKFSKAIESLLGPAEGATTWKSFTPFVLPRYCKAKGKDTLLGQINAELTSRGFPAARSVELCAKTSKGFRHYITSRRVPHSQPPSRQGFGFTLTFDSPVRGPVVLGYGSHFGLGVFKC